MRSVIAVVLLAACSKSAPSGPATCERAADKLIALSLEQGKAIGREWSAEKQQKKRADFLGRCNEGLANGSMTTAKLDCVLRATAMPAAQQCMQ